MSANARQLTALMDRLAAGNDIPSAEFSLLSDLDREDAEHCRKAWGNLPAGVRERVMTRCTELAEDKIDLDFTRLGRIGLDDPEAAVRSAAMLLLWESEDRHVGTRLAQLLRDDPDESVRSDAASALARFVLAIELEAFDAALGDRIVDALHESARDQLESVDVRASAIESLGCRSLPWVDTLITDAYYEDDRRLRRAAIYAMGASAQEKWLDYLDDESRSDNPEFRHEAAVAIGVVASEKGIDTLAALLDDEDLEVRAAALTSLGEIGGEEALRLLREFVDEGPAELADVAKAAITMALLLAGEDDGGSLLSL